MATKVDKQTGRAGVEITLPGGTRLSSSDAFVTNIMLAEMPGYFAHGIQLSPGDIVFDVGANVGMFSMWVADQYGDVQVYAFEPVKPAFDVLDFNIARAGKGNIRAFPFGLSRSCTTTEFTVFPRATVLSSSRRSRVDPLNREAMKRALVAVGRQRGFPRLRWLPSAARPRVAGLLADLVLRHETKRLSATAATVACEVRRLSQVISDEHIQRIDLLKIDVEGAELDVLAGIEARHWPIIKQIVMEVEVYSRDSVVIAAMLRAEGFTNIDFEQGAAQRELDIGLLFARR